jgi:hypothetical protein
MIRLEVTEGRPLRTTVAYVDTDVPPALTDLLRPIADQAVEAVAARCNLHAGDARLLLAGELAKLRADCEAYEREAARRGVLAL